MDGVKRHKLSRVSISGPDYIDQELTLRFVDQQHHQITMQFVLEDGATLEEIADLLEGAARTIRDRVSIINASINICE
ncbi:hypothetical protein UFOVP602_35 [uncultured Caudovirales phage]|uniref:Uncharacterized protein n=1 Tax=uncultured Caudovirales phage TaxID=2100421 RepID=A0A6J5N4Q5_9CAUD|nr:hypothetical protein UFOVP602_35 [uncultured Caudovirales phage]